MAEEDLRAVEDRAPQQNGFLRRWLIRLAALLAAFLLGFVPMWLSNRTVTADLNQTKRELRRNQIQNTLSAAAISARRGDYEPSRQAASTFFSEVQAELDNPNSDILTAQEKTQLPVLLSSRDDVITLLSRGDPAAAEKLSDTYIAYRAVTTVPKP